MCPIDNKFDAINSIAPNIQFKTELSDLDIEKIVFDEVGKANNITNPTLEEIFEVDRLIREKLG